MKLLGIFLDRGTAVSGRRGAVSGVLYGVIKDENGFCLNESKLI